MFDNLIWLTIDAERAVSELCRRLLIKSTSITARLPFEKYLAQNSSVLPKAVTLKKSAKTFWATAHIRFQSIQRGAVQLFLQFPRLPNISKFLIIPTVIFMTILEVYKITTGWTEKFILDKLSRHLKNVLYIIYTQIHL